MKKVISMFLFCLVVFGLISCGFFNQAPLYEDCVEGHFKDNGTCNINDWHDASMKYYSEVLQELDWVADFYMPKLQNDINFEDYRHDVIGFDILTDDFILSVEYLENMIAVLDKIHDDAGELTSKDYKTFLKIEFDPNYGDERYYQSINITRFGDEYEISVEIRDDDTFQSMFEEFEDLIHSVIEMENVSTVIISFSLKASYSADSVSLVYDGDNEISLNSFFYLSENEMTAVTNLVKVSFPTYSVIDITPYIED